MEIDFAYLKKLSLIKQQVRLFSKENKDFLDPFLDDEKGVLNAYDINNDTKFHSTSTGFAFYYLSQIISLSEKGISSSIVRHLRSLLLKFGKDLVESFLTGHKDKERTQTAKLPNNYNTPFQALGVLSFLDNQGKDVIEGKTVKECLSLMETLINENFSKEIVENNGFIGRIGSPKVPSPYLTFWVLEFIGSYDKITKKQHLDDLYIPTINWATNSLSRAISFNYAGVPQAFDAIEVMYLLLILSSLLQKETVKEKDVPDYKIRKLILHTLGIVFSKYFSSGCFTKSLPVFADTMNFSLSCPTVEPVSLFLIKYPEYLLDHYSDLSSIYSWIIENKIDSPTHKAKMWRSEWEHPSSEPTSFMTLSVFTFIVAYYEYIDLLLSIKSSEILGVLPYYENKGISKIQYPKGFRKTVENNIIKPIKNNQKNLQSFSIILYGPPGTSKTTISKKIAQDLEWPLLIINTNTFLKSGIEKIDFEADRVFQLVSYLKNVVVLFDEVEELILDRSNEDEQTQSDQRSRLLTTSMLPRINDLRNTNRVVFIFATNYLNHMDPAVVRNGRFDCVQCILPPTKEEKKEIIKFICAKHAEYKELESLLLTEEILDSTVNFCFADLEALVKRIIVRYNNKVEGEDLKSIVWTELGVGKGAIISEDVLSKFEKNKKLFDRPNY